MQDVVIDKKISVDGSFILERDGTTSHINIANSPDSKTDSIVTSAITRIKWIAATQGGTPVRTLYPSGKNGNLSKKYFNQIYKIYVEH